MFAQNQTRMHSSRMRTVRLLTVSRSIRLEGGGICPGVSAWGCESAHGRVCPVGCLPGGGISRGCLPKGGGCLPKGGGCLPSGVSTWGWYIQGVSAQGRGVSAERGGCLPRGSVCLGVSAQGGRREGGVSSWGSVADTPSPGS